MIGHTNTSYENELSGLQEMMKTGLFDEEWYQKELKIIKEIRYKKNKISLDFVHYISYNELTTKPYLLRIRRYARIVASN